MLTTSTPKKKKSKYHPVTTNTKREKKQSSLSSYTFSVNNKNIDFPTFKKEVENFFKLSVSRTVMDIKVYEYFRDLCNETWKEAVGILKRCNDGYRSDNERFTVVAFDTKPIDGASNKEQTGCLKLADLGRTWTFDDLAKTITIELTPSVYGGIAEHKTIVNDYAVRLNTTIEGFKHDMKKRTETKNWESKRLTEGWLEIGKEIDLLTTYPPERMESFDNEPILEGARITDLAIRITKQGEEQSDVVDEILTIDADKNSCFVRKVDSKDANARVVAFMIDTNLHDLIKSFVSSKNMTEEDLLSRWGVDVYTKEIELSLFCTGKLDVVTGKINVVSSIIFKKAPEDFSSKTTIQVVSYKTDVSVYTKYGEKNEIGEDILKEIF